MLPAPGVLRRRRGKWSVTIAALAIAALCAACGSSDSTDSAAKGPQHVDFQLNFLPGGTTMGYFIADYKGFYKAEGLDVTVRSSSDPTLSIKLISSGQRDIGAVYTADMINAAVAGNPVTMVWSNDAQNPFGIISEKKSGITSPADLRGKKVGITNLVLDRAYFAAMLKSAGLSENDVTVVNPGSGGIQQVLQGNLDATSGITSYEPVVMEQQGVPYNFMYYKDYGAPNAPFSGVAVNPDWLAKSNHGDIVKRFLRALDKAQAWTSSHLEEATDLFVSHFPNIKKATAMAQYKASYVPDLHGHSDIGTYQQLADFLAEQGAIAHSVDVKKYVTNEYLPDTGK